MSVLCFVMLALDIHRVLYVGFLRGVFPCGSLRTVCICWNFNSFGGRFMLEWEEGGVIKWKGRVLLRSGKLGLRFW